jgi:GTP cyclohydrolase I
MSDRVKITKLPTANGNMPLSDEEKLNVINDATFAYEKFLDALRIDWRNDPNSDNTPRRVAKAYVNDLAAGCYNDLPNVTAFPSDGYDGMVFQGGIPVKSLCSHHHLAFSGVAHVAYIPSKDGKVIGLSKLNRIVEHFARRPQIQEGLSVQIHNAINEICEGNSGVAVMLSATHTCACNRGVKHDGCEMKTSKLSGDFMQDASTRSEYYNFVTQWYQNR